MKYWSEDEGRALRSALEQAVLAWPRVSARKMFGCPCYQVGRRLFAFLVSGGVVLTRLTPAERERLAQDFATAPFDTGTKRIKSWVKVTLNTDGELARLLPYVRASYSAALAGAADSDGV